MSFLVISTHGFSKDIGDKQIAFANEFAAAVADHSEKKTMKYLDKKYKKEQLEFLKGNKVEVGSNILSNV